MDCNKDDAIKAKMVAEKKFNAKDMAGAKKFALKAQKLYPALEGIAQLLATLDVYAASAANQACGEADWYGVLGVSPQADEDTIRKHYRKLALMLHPDKNKSIGAEGAFKLISEAWSLLSDRNRRASYDAKRTAKTYQQKDKFGSNSSSMPPRGANGNGFYDFAKAATSKPKVNHKNTNGPSASGSTSKTHRTTFWTVCHRCRMQYEYLRSYLHHNLLCPNCQLPFFAVETPPPVSNGVRSSSTWKSAQHGQNSHQEARNKSSSKAGYNSGNFDWVPFSGPAGASSVAQAANVVQQTYEKVKRVREEAQAAKKREKAAKRKNYSSENIVNSSFDKKLRVGDDMCMNNNQTGLKASNPFKHHGPSESIQRSDSRKVNRTRELLQIESRNMLTHKARTEIHKKISEWKLAGSIAAPKDKVVDEAHEKDKWRTKAEINDDTHDPDSRSVGTGRQVEDKSLHSATLMSTAKEVLDQNSISVPDPDFHNFDKHRTEKSFGENQVWAVYDNNDGMPRYYAMVHRVISEDPFVVRMSWLISNTNIAPGPPNWAGSGFAKTCGDYRIGRHETYSGLNSFSHQVRWTKGTHGSIRIFPRRGEVWALYRNWSPDWNEFTPHEVVSKYDMVEVVTDYDERLGVVVIPLVKVAGFKAVFHPHLDTKQAKRIPKEEIVRFSYQVPSHLLSGHEAPNSPKGCWELDPAALPHEFLQVIADGKKIDVDEDHATQTGDISDGST